MYRKIRLALSAVLCAALVSGCGFALQGAEPLPSAMARTYLETDEPRSEFYVSLRDALRRRGAEIVERPEDATSVLKILEDATDERVMSVTARNVPREYEIYYAVTFTLEAEGEQLIEPQSIVATRVYAWNENELLGKIAEERILRQALAEDLARRVLRRIEASRRHGPLPAS
ncbi:MAG TPA: LPS assembly lipoprotein LptE [Gammaproteobacteria bacterium]